jgi:hypothetical protein
MRMRPVRYAIGTAMYGAAAARQITSMGVRYEPLLTLERSHRQIKDIGAYMKKFNNTLKGRDCGDAGLPANSHEIAKPKTMLRVIPRILETSGSNHLSRPEANSGSCPRLFAR